MHSIVFTLGRFNPPTLGHQRLINRVVDLATEIGSDHVVYLSQTQHAATDPLNWNFKRRVCRVAFPDANISSDTKIRNPYLALEHLKNHYNRIVLVAGDDQVEEYRKRFTSYANTWKIDFEIVSAGERNKDATGIEGISATKMREYARNGEVDKFIENLPSRLSHSARMLVYRGVRKGLK